MDAEIIEAVKRYYDDRGLVFPTTTTQAVMFLVSEVGELADAVVHKSDDWLRNNERERSVPDEIADVLMMLYVTAILQDVKPFQSLRIKMQRKLKNE